MRDRVHRRAFGRTGIEVSEVGVGCGALGGPGKTGLEAALRRAVDLGIDLFDTADTYTDGCSETTLGRVFASVPRHRLVLATKFGTVRGFFGGHRKDFSVKHMRRMFEQSLRRLRTDYIDIYQLHNPPQSLLGREELWRELDRMLEVGKIRCYGLSCERPDLARDFLRSTRGLGLQMILNLLNQGSREVLADLGAYGAGMLVKVPLAGGALTDRFGPHWPPIDDQRRQRWGEPEFAERLRWTQALRPILTSGGRTMSQGALAWLLTISTDVIPIPGITSLEALEETAAAAGSRLSPEQMRAIDELGDGALRGMRCRW